MAFDKLYAQQYDGFYKEKNYTAECDLMERVFRRLGVSPGSLLDLGCGTGSHAIIMSKRGYQVTGVDRSRHMLAEAKEKTFQAGCDITFAEADISALDFGTGVSFDAVVSMFAVMGYLTENATLEKTLISVRRLLRPGGVFLFDCWYGPAVLAERPQPRIHRYVSAQGRAVLRLATPELDHLSHTVNVRYHVLEMDGKHIMAEAHETHSMRYFFPLEIRYFLEKAGFNEVYLYSFDDLEAPLSPDCWNMMVVAR